MDPLTYKVFNLCSFIRCGTYNSHLYTTFPLKSESINSPSSGSSYLLVSPLLISPQGPTLYRRCCFLRKQTGCLSRTLRRTGLWYHCWVTGGARGTVHIEARTTTLARKAPQCDQILMLRFWEPFQPSLHQWQFHHSLSSDL